MQNSLSTKQTMTIQEVSSALGASRTTIERAVKMLYPDIIQHGRTTYLSEYQVTQIKIKLQTSNSFNLEGVTTDLEMAEKAASVMKWLHEKISTLQMELDTVKPKAIVYDKFMDGSNGQPIGDVAKVIGRKPNELHRLLREAKIMRDNYTPFSEYSHYFIVKEKPLPNGKNTFVSYVLPEGFNYIQKRFGN